MQKANILAVATIFLGTCSGAQAALRVTAIAAGGQHSLALASDGTVWFWGPSPVPVSGLSGVVAITSAYAHSFPGSSFLFVGLRRPRACYAL